MKVIVPKGSRAATIWDENDSEYEVLVQRNSRFVVKGYEKVNGQVVLVVTLDQSHLEGGKK